MKYARQCAPNIPIWPKWLAVMFIKYQNIRIIKDAR